VLIAMLASPFHHLPLMNFDLPSHPFWQSIQLLSTAVGLTFHHMPSTAPAEKWQACK
jgi:hypothetical protein